MLGANVSNAIDIWIKFSYKTGCSLRLQSYLIK